MAEVQSESNHNGGVLEGGGDESFVPKAEGFWVLYQGCWLRAPAVQSVKIVQEQFKARPDDILLVTYPKCGTTWLKALAFAVTNRFRHAATSADHPLLTQHPQDLVPFLEMPYRQLHPLADLEKLPSPRLLSTHLPDTLLPPCVATLGCRVVYLCRSPKDVLVSLWHFLYKVNKNYSIDKAFELFCKGESSYGPIWEHNLGFWKESISNNDRVLFLKYDEMMAQPVEHVKMLAEFVRVPFTEEEIRCGVVEDVVQLCSFDTLKSMPANSSGVSDRIGGVPMENSSFFRTAKVGDWANHLTVEMAGKLDDIVEEKLRGSDLAF
ncbi:cytosolic sulfotransferase 16-like [Hordeum vulgare subsp. vulgare]|uniref:Sulfotransferase n=1 Tax=Hordeum vulgare subsp. vulgare TaxID=112509 RepID=A0A8I6XSJ7_HORVV|nr:cytosolic sulfotransferase 16-like [Hordeum vulgare subsp. vulgare]